MNFMQDMSNNLSSNRFLADYEKQRLQGIGGFNQTPSNLPQPKQDINEDLMNAFTSAMGSMTPQTGGIQAPSFNLTMPAPTIGAEQPVLNPLIQQQQQTLPNVPISYGNNQSAAYGGSSSSNNNTAQFGHNAGPGSNASAPSAQQYHGHEGGSLYFQNNLAQLPHF